MIKTPFFQCRGQGFGELRAHMPHSRVKEKKKNLGQREGISGWTNIVSRESEARLNESSFKKINRLI